MSGMQRLNMLAAMAAFLYGAYRGWPILLSLEKALMVYVTVFGAQILVIMGLLKLAESGSGRVE
jgi:hypothetical protein